MNNLRHGKQASFCWNLRPCLITPEAGLNFKSQSQKHGVKNIQEHAGTWNTPCLAQISIQEQQWRLFLRILSQNGRLTLKINVNDLHFQYQPRVSQDACLVQIWAIQAGICDCDELWHGQVKFPRILSQNDLKVKVNDPNFHYQLGMSR